MYQENARRKRHKIMRVKTIENPKKAGRPKGESTSVVSVRIPTTLKKELDERYGKNWLKLFRDFCRVYLMDKE